MIEKEVEQLLSKESITSVNQEEEQFLSTLVVSRKDGNQRSLRNVKKLNHFIPY